MRDERSQIFILRRQGSPSLKNSEKKASAIKFFLVIRTDVDAGFHSEQNGRETPDSVHTTQG